MDSSDALMYGGIAALIVGVGAYLYETTKGKTTIMPSAPSLTTSISGLTVTLTVGYESQSTQSPSSISIDWGDNSIPLSPSSIGTFEHTYSSSGTYTITVTFVYPGNISPSSTVTVAVSSGGGGGGSGGGGSSSQKTLFAPKLNVNVSGNSVSMTVDTSESTATITQVVVDWGDGSSYPATTGAMNYYHTYSNPGTYTIKVTISDAYGDSAFSTATVNISGASSSTSYYSSSSVSSSSSLGTYSNPYLFDNGYVGQGYYEFTPTEYSKLLKIPASGITVNPTWIASSTFFSGIQYWLSYTASTGPITTGGGTTTTSVSPRISISPTTIAEVDGSSITITGTGFTPNGKGNIFAGTSSMGGIGISGFTADSSGNFSVTATYQFNQTTVSGLANALQDATGNFIDITAYDYTAAKYSNTVVLYFST